MVVPQSITDLCNEVVEWMDPQRDAQFPFCDTYLMWHYFPPKYDIEVYNCTYPYWRTHGNTIMEDISTQGEFRETIEKIVIVSKKGINDDGCQEFQFLPRLLCLLPPFKKAHTHRRYKSILFLALFQLVAVSWRRRSNSIF